VVALTQTRVLVLVSVLAMGLRVEVGVLRLEGVLERQERLR
jgi:hypothetical protein